MNSEATDVVIVGAGVVGCSIALSLATAGRRVTVVDRGMAAGAGTTSCSSAVVRFNYSTLDGVLASWAAGRRWLRWPDFLGVEDPDGFARFHRVGKVVIDPPGYDHTPILRLFDKVGVPYEEWDTAELRRRVPALDPGRFWPPKPVHDDAFYDPPNGEIGVYFTPDAGFVDDPQLSAHNLMVAAAHHGATFRFRTPVTGVRRDGTRAAGVDLDGGDVIDAPVVVNAAGPWSAAFNALAGVLDDFKVTTRPLRQEVHVVPAPADFVMGNGGVLCADLDLGTYFRPQPGGTILVGGTEPECDPLQWLDDPDSCNPLPTVEVWEAQVMRLARRVPELAIPPQPRGLASVYDVTQDWVPIYDRTSLGGYYVAIGTSGNQFKNAPVIGDLMAGLIDAGDRGHDHDADPVHIALDDLSLEINMAHYSRRRTVLSTTNSVMA